MKIDKKESTYNTNINESNSDNFSFHDEGLIMSLIQDKMYQKKLYTPIQEILSNARDAVRELHHNNLSSENLDELSMKRKIDELYALNKNIEITLPNELNPVLIIRDYGVGISPERLTLIKRVGLSTKNKSNVQTGGFGLGLKSAFAYTEQFFIVSYYNGIEYTYICQKNVNKMGAIVLLNETSSQEQNGVEIRIPIKNEDNRALSAHITEIVRFWACKPKVNGLDLIVNNNVLNLQNGSLIAEYNYHLAVIDGIPYQLDINRYFKADLIYDKLNNQKIILFFNVGEIDLVMTREGLEDSVKNNTTISKRINDLFVEMKVYSEQRILSVKESLKGYTDVYNELSLRFKLATLIDPAFSSFEIDKDSYLIVINQGKVVFHEKTKRDDSTYKRSEIFFNVLTSETIYTKKYSAIDNERAAIGTVREFIVYGDNDYSFKNISISDDVLDKNIGSYSERKRKEIYNLNKKAIDSGYIFITNCYLEHSDTIHKTILLDLMAEFGLPNVKIQYPANLRSLDELNVLRYSKKTNSICHSSKTCKLDGKTKYKRYQSTTNVLREICMEIDSKYSINREKFFSLLKEFDIELIYSEEKIFEPFTISIFDDLFTVNINKILDQKEMTQYFIRSELSNVHKLFGLWSSMTKENQNRKVITNNNVMMFLSEEFYQYKEPESTWRWTSAQTVNDNAKMSYYKNLLRQNKDLYQQMADTFKYSLIINKLLENHVILKNAGHDSSYYYTTGQCLLLNNCIDYINTFLVEQDVKEICED
jgi:hypothetical protein